MLIFSICTNHFGNIPLFHPTSPKRIIKNALGLRAPRGWGWLANPKKAAYNRVYNRTSFSLLGLIKKLFK